MKKKISYFCFSWGSLYGAINVGDVYCTCFLDLYIKWRKPAAPTSAVNNNKVWYIRKLPNIYNIQN